MPYKEQRERIIAELYDRHSSEFYDYHAKRGDVEFYVDFAVESGGTVLDIGCGTGRILIPTSRAGVSITGLDKSVEMLDICRRKLENESPDVRDRVKLVHADMSEFNLKSRFSLVTIPFGAFNSLVTVEEQLSCLNCIKQHLLPNGALVFDLFYPSSAEFSSGEEGFTVKTPFEMPDGRSVTWGICFSSVDYNRQTIQEEMTYYVHYPDGHDETLVYPSCLRYFYRYEVEHLLARVGFKAESVYADFDRKPFGSKYPSELIFLARMT
ncbi:class I SAM-dependent DNA methyltransferase [Chloroflexota bacterium]